MNPPTRTQIQFRQCILLVLLICGVAALTAVLHRPSQTLQIVEVDTDRFGHIRIQTPSRSPTAFFIFLGSSPTSQSMLEIQKHALEHVAAFASLDTATYLKNLPVDDDDCYSLAGEMERLSQVLQHRASIEHLMKSVLVGNGDGGAIVYSIIAGAPTSFAGAISLDFCPTLPVQKVICKEEQPPSRMDTEDRLLHLEPSDALITPWLVVRAPEDRTCSSVYQTYRWKTYKSKQEISFPISGSSDKIAMAFLDRFFVEGRISSAPSDAPTTALPDLPIVELPNSRTESDFFVVLLTGDGGWAAIDDAVAERLHTARIPVVGLNILKYLWVAKTPEQAASDLSRIVEEYSQKWGMERVVTIGYSLGSDVLPFMVNRLPERTRRRVSSVVLLNPWMKADFEVHFSDWLNLPDSEGGAAIVPEIQRLKGINVLCIYGAAEEDTACRNIHEDFVRVTELPGSHHFDGDYDQLASVILHGITETTRSRTADPGDGPN